jgi:hemoglobin
LLDEALSGCEAHDETRFAVSWLLLPCRLHGGGQAVGQVHSDLRTRLGTGAALALRTHGRQRRHRQVVASVIADPDIKDKHKKHFMEGDVAGLKKRLVDQVGEATGGPQKYTGKNMKDAHLGLAITDKDFDALVVDLTKALDSNKVGKAEQQELLDMLAPMRKDIVESKD